jgi:excisionase family DNA binding protein
VPRHLRYLRHLRQISLSATVLFMRTEHEKRAESLRTPLSREPLVPKPEEIEEAKRVVEAAHRACEDGIAIRLRDRAGSSKSIVLSTRLGRFFLQAFSQLAQGNAVRLVHIRRELTTHEAADLLNVSRTYLIGLLDKGDIPYRMVGSHRRIGLTDLLAYREKTDRRREEALATIAAEAQELKLYE